MAIRIKAAWRRADYCGWRKQKVIYLNNQISHQIRVEAVDLISTPSAVYFWIYKWKNYWNRSIFAKVVINKNGIIFDQHRRIGITVTWYVYSGGEREYNGVGLVINGGQVIFPVRSWSTVAFQTHTLPADAIYVRPVNITWQYPLPAQCLLSSSLLCCRLHSLTFSTGQSPRPGSQQQQLQATT